MAMNLGNKVSFGFSAVVAGQKTSGNNEPQLIVNSTKGKFTVTSPVTRAMGVAGVDSMTQEEYRKAAIDAVKKLSADVGIPSVLEAVKEEDLQFLADSAHADACAPGNPKDASVEDLKDLFRKIMA